MSLYTKALPNNRWTQHIVIHIAIKFEFKTEKLLFLSKEIETFFYEKKIKLGHFFF